MPHPSARRQWPQVDHGTVGAYRGCSLAWVAQEARVLHQKPSKWPHSPRGARARICVQSLQYFLGSTAHSLLRVPPCPNMVITKGLLWVPPRTLILGHEVAQHLLALLTNPRVTRRRLGHGGACARPQRRHRVARKAVCHTVGRRRRRIVWVRRRRRRVVGGVCRRVRGRRAGRRAGSRRAVRRAAPTLMQAVAAPVGRAAPRRLRVGGRARLEQSVGRRERLGGGGRRPHWVGRRPGLTPPADGRRQREVDLLG
jgi:hypothetical protein